MSRNERGLPNVLPKGAVEPISNMDLVMAKLNHDARINSKTVERIVIGNKK